MFVSASTPKTDDMFDDMICSKIKKLFICSMLLKSKQEKIKMLQQFVQKQKNKISSLQNVPDLSKEKNLLNKDASDVLLESFGKHQGPVEMFNNVFDMLNTRSIHCLRLKKAVWHANF